jgi:NADPH2:quinone reductase
MPHAILIAEAGGPEVMKWSTVELAKPGPGEVLVRHKAVGVNFVDVYNRTGLYKPAGGYPFTPGAEAAGVVEAVGSGVTLVKPGDRVVYQGSIGSYASHRIINADRLIIVPDGISDKEAAAVFLKGLTAQCLLQRTFKLEKGHTILFHAAAGGVGLIATQWAAALGATVIGTVGSEEKAKLARTHGCTHVINYRTEDFVKRVKEITDGKGVDVVYDSVGKDTFPGSLDCLKPMGLWAAFGQSSGVVPDFPINLLMQKGALFATRMTIMVYCAKRPDYEASAHELFDVLRSGRVKVEIGQEFALKDAADAHRALESRKTTGATVLVP